MLLGEDDVRWESLERQVLPIGETGDERYVVLYSNNPRNGDTGGVRIGTTVRTTGERYVSEGAATCNHF